MGLIDSLERRGSPENPATSLSNPASWLLEAFGAAGTQAGISVSEASALNYAVWYQCINIVAKGVAVAPLITYERTESGRRRADDLAVYHLLHRRPNPEMTAYQFKETLALSWANWGRGCAEIEWGRNGDPVGLWWLPPADCSIARTGSRPTVRGLEPDTKYLRVTVPTGVQPPVGLVVSNGYAYLPPGKYLHIPGPSFDGLDGTRPVMRAKEVLGHAGALERFGATFFGRGAKAATLVMPKEGHTATPRARDSLQERLSQQLSGLSNQHRLAVLEAGIDVKVIGVEPNAAQFIESRQFLGEEICRFHDVPPYRVGLDKSGQSYASIEAKQLDLAQWTHLPTLIRFEQVFTHELMPDRVKRPRDRRFFAEFLFEALLRADSKTRADVERLQITSGLRTINEIRQQNNWETLDIPEADVPWQQINMAPISSGSDSDRSPEPTPRALSLRRQPEARARLSRGRQRLIRSYVPAFLRYAERVVSREVGGLRRLVTRVFSAPDPLRRLVEELRAYYESFPDILSRDLAPMAFALAEALAGSVSDELGTDALVTPEVEKMANDFSRAAAARHVQKSIAMIVDRANRAEESSEDPLEQAEAASAAIAELLDHWQEERAEDAAQREAFRAAGALSIALYAAAGVQSLVWSGGDCDLCSTLNGAVVGTAQPFVPEGGTVNAEGANALTVPTAITHPPLHNSCDCVILAA